MQLTKRQAGIVFFSFTVVLSIFIIAWMVFINKGTLVLHGEPLYFLEVPGTGQRLCEDETCKMRIAPGKYNITVSKRGYYDENLDVEVQRWQEAEFNVFFTFIPTLIESNLTLPYAFPEGYEDFLSETNKINLTSFTEIEKDLQDLPANPKVVSFSPKGSYLYVEAKDNLVFDLENDKKSEVEIPKEVIPLWSPDESKFVYLNINKENQNQTLYQFNLKMNKSEIVTAFLRDFKDYKVYFADDSNKLIIVDLQSRPNEVFLVDLKEKSKRVLFVVPGFQELKWSKSGNYFVYSNVVDGTFSTNLFDIINDASTPVFTNFDLDKVEFTSDDNIIFISDKSAETPLEQDGGSITFDEAIGLFEEALTEEGPATPEESITEAGPEEPIFFINFNKDEKIYSDISSISADQRIVVERIELNEDDSSLLFWTGVNIYEMKLKE